MCVRARLKTNDREKPSLNYKGKIKEEHCRLGARRDREFLEANKSLLGPSVANTGSGQQTIKTLNNQDLCKYMPFHQNCCYHGGKKWLL